MRKLKILVAEDNQINQELINTILKLNGHTVIIANNGNEVLNYLENNDFDIVLMDIQMPHKDGIDTTKAIRSSTTGKINKDIPIIALTAQSMNGDRERILEAGMNEYITKPLNFSKLNELLEKYSN